MVALELELPAQRDAPACARRALAGLFPFVADEQFHYAELLVSELVTNSVRHAGLGPGDEVRVTIRLEDSTLRVEVADPGAGFDPAVQRDRPRARDAPTTGGYGLFLVAELATRWGVSHDDITLVWFELAPHYARDVSSV